MKSILITACLLLVSSVVFSQKLALSAGLGLGLASNKGASPGVRGTVYASGYYNIDKQLSLGVELANSGSLIGYPNKSGFNETGTIENRDPSGMHANTILAKGRYTWTDKDLQLFAELGLGVNTFFAKNLTYNVDKVSRKNFAWQPEVGFVVSRFQLSVCYLHGGYTPYFYGSNQTYDVSLPSISISTFFVKAGFRLELLKGR